MARWAAFAGITLAVLIILLGLARLTQAVVPHTSPVTRGDTRWLDRLPDGASHLDTHDAPIPTRQTPAEATLDPDTPGNPSTIAILINVAVSQGLFALLLLGGIWLTDVPATAFGVTDTSLASGPMGVAVGLAIGGGLAAANIVVSLLAVTLETDPGERLRALLTPETPRGWLVLLGVVLPVIAGFEELLFRGALVGAFAVGFNISPWLLAVTSSAAFALGHGAQGRLGISVTGLLGFALAAVFILTESLLVVIIAHYVVNAVEFIVMEGLDWRPTQST